MDQFAPSTGHPSDAVLLAHTAGTLGLAHHLVVLTHIQSCEQCRTTVRLCDELGGLLAPPAPSAPAPAGLLDRCLAAIGAEAAQSGHTAPEPRVGFGGVVLPASLSGLRPTKLRTLAPGLKHSTLWHDDRGTLHFIRVKAGARLPAHTHRGLELTCVLSGAFHDDKGRYAAGDVTEEDDDPQADAADHSVVAETASDCVCIMATTGRMRFSGWLARMLQPVMPF